MAAGTKGKMAEQKKAGFAGRQTESLPARLLKDMRKNWILYVMILPVVVYYIIFHMRRFTASSWHLRII